MKKIILFITAMLAISTAAEAQFFNNILNSAKKTAERSIEKNVDKKVEQSIDKVFNPKTGKYEQVPQQTAGWTCPACGKSGNTGNFCAECGAKRPDAAWVCPACGKTGNTGKFCGECGAPRPDVAASQAADAASVAAQQAAAQAMAEAAAQLNAAQAAAQSASQTASEEVEMTMAQQMAAFKALGNLTDEEMAHLMRLAEKLDKMSDAEAQTYIFSNPEELAFLMNLQMKLAAAYAQPQQQ